MITEDGEKKPIHTVDELNIAMASLERRVAILEEYVERVESLRQGEMGNGG